MIKKGKRFGKRMTAFFLSFVMVMSLTIGIAPMEAKAATEPVVYENCTLNITSEDTLLEYKSYVKSDVIITNNFKDTMTVSCNNVSKTIQKGESIKLSDVMSGISYFKNSGISIFMKNLSLSFTPLVASISYHPTGASNLKYTGRDLSLLSYNGEASNGYLVYSLSENGSYSLAVPKAKDVGEYTVWYKPIATATYYSDGEKWSTTVKIDKGTPTSSMIPKTPTVSSVSYGTKLSDISLGSYWKWKSSGSTVPNVGSTSYTVVYDKTLDTKNYDWSGVSGYNSSTGKIERQITVTVNPVAKTDDTFTVPTNLSATYNSTKTLNQQITLPANWAWEAGAASAVPKVSDKQFKAVYTVPSQDAVNYTWNQVTGYKNENGTIKITKTLPVTIRPATQSVTLSMADYKFGGTISTPTITGAKESPNVTYYYNTTNSNEGGTEWKNMTSETLDKGTYYMYAKLDATANYAAYTTPTKKFTVSPKTMTGITAVNVEVDYDGEEHFITVSGYPQGATVTFGESEGACDSSSSPTYTEARTEPYTVYYKITAKGYSDYEDSATVKINQKEAELQWGETTFEYNYGVQVPSATVTNLCGEDSCTVTVDGGKTNYSATAYTATAIALSNSNYKLPDIDTKKQTSFTITQKPLSINWSDTEFTYNGTNQKPTATLVGVFDGDTCNVTVSGEQTNAGTDYTATATIDNDNYKLTNGTTPFSIQRKSLTESTVAAVLTDVSYNEEDESYCYDWDGNFIEPTISITDSETGQDVELVRGKDFIVSGTNSECEVGIYTIVLTGNGNYKDVAKVKWRITKGTVGPVVKLSDWTYGDEPNTPVVISADDNVATPTYTYYLDEQCTNQTTLAKGAKIPGGVPSFAGTYWVKADFAGTEEYAAVSKTESFTILPKDITVTPKDGQKKTYGERDPEFIYTAALVGEDTLKGSLSRVVGEDKGSYVITQGTITNEENPNYNITFVTDKVFTIEAKKLTEKMVSVSPINYVYDGNEHMPVTTAEDTTTKVEGTGIDEETDIELRGSKEASECGVYNIYFVGKGNYTGTVKKQWCISLTGGPEEEPIIPGNFEKDAKVAPDAPISEATINNAMTEIVNAPAIFTEEDKLAVEKGDDARLWLEVTKTDERNIFVADMIKMIEATTQSWAKIPEFTFFEADLFKQITGQEKIQIHEPGMNMSITIKIPDELINEDTTMVREYQIIRLHTDETTNERQVDVLQGDFNALTKEFTFETDKFSTYAIVYSDKKLVSSVSLNKSSETLTKASETLQLAATVTPGDAANKNVTWKTSNPAVATVDAKGEVTAVANGTCTITVTTEDGGKSAVCVITVAIPSTDQGSQNQGSQNQDGQNQSSQNQGSQNQGGQNQGGQNQGGQNLSSQNQSSQNQKGKKTDETEDTIASQRVLHENALALNEQLKVTQTGKKITVRWGKVKGADGYLVYVQYANKKFTSKSVNIVKGGEKTKLTVGKISNKKIDTKKDFKVYVEAYKMVGKKRVSLDKSITTHVAGSKNKTYTNPKTIKLKKKSYELKVSESGKIKATIVKINKKKKILSNKYAKTLRYASSNDKVATVSKTGKIKAVGKGTCTIYVYAKNGNAKRVKVTVR